MFHGVLAEQICELTINYCFGKAKLIKQEIKTEAMDLEMIELLDFLEADERIENDMAVEGEDDDITVEKEVSSFEEAKRAWITALNFMLRSERQRDVRYQPKEYAPAGDSSEHWDDMYLDKTKLFL
ncbi:hypothetical protein RF11_06490 [Thelohanellus kitauei]|uniref:Uncharacterized protein n=1 Tax=Thelohanellus kitauei TaxID=669202 RepID=A0A0C2JXX7_THEKT|nr:hypothetical protein RF11_06490 [Thelohanellus kitauei]